MAGWFKQMPLAEVGLEYTLWCQRTFHPPPPTPSPPLSVSLKRWAQITDDMSLGSGTLALQEGTQPTRKRLSPPHPCVMELSGS